MTDTIFDTVHKAKAALDTKRPPMYVIILHNDNSTTPDVVLHALIAHMRLAENTAIHTMLTAHTSGTAPCGVYTKDIAEHMIAAAMGCPTTAGTELSFTAEAQ